MNKMRSIFSIMGLGIIGIISFFNFSDTSILTSSLFVQTNSSIQQDVIVYVKNATAQKGETGEIAIIANQNISMQGFSFDVSYPANVLNANGFSIDSTALANKNFIIQDNRNTPGKISIVGASASNATINAGETILLLSFTVNSSAENQTVPISFASANIVNSNLTEQNIKTANGSITIAESSVFSVTKLTPSAKGTIEVVFSDIVATGLQLSSAQFSASILTNSSAIAQNGNVVQFSGLNLQAGTRYSMTFHTDVKSVQGVALQEKQRVIEFLVPNDGTTISGEYEPSLGITSVVAKDMTHIDMVLSSIPKGDTFPVSSIAIKNNTESITILSITQDSADKKLFHLVTSSLQPKTPYSFMLLPLTWKASNDKYAGGKLSEILWTPMLSAEPSITQVSPYRPVQGVASTINIIGTNFPTNVQVFLGGQALSGVLVSADKKTITATIPASLASGNYTLELQWTEGSNSKFLRQENALVMESKSENEIQVISSKSYSSPNKVPNDGATPVKLFVYVDDPRGLADLEKVTADLRVIHGNAAESLKPGPIENGQQVFFLENVTVPATVQTQTTPYKIPVVAQNKSGLHAEGTVDVWVSRDTTSSVPPRIVNFTVTPSTITAGDKDHSILLSAEISDEDSGEEISTVAVDMSSVGVNTVFLTARNTGQVTGKTKFFENSTPIVVPTEIPNGEYTIKLKVIDAQGDEATLEKKVTVTRLSGLGPTIGSEDAYVTPSKSLIKNGDFSFAIHTKVTDPSGSDNITAVSLNLAAIGLPPTVMTGGAKEGLSQWFSSPVLKVPSATSVGKKQVNVTATDKQGNSYTHDIWVEVMYQPDTGRPPVIESEKGYITPSKAINDGISTFSAYVFVKDADDDISHVVLKLENTALYNGAALPKGTSSVNLKGEEVCVSTRTLLCMQPILKEATGQWYYLSDIIIPNTTPARDTPYSLVVNAFDKNGKISEGKLDIIVANPGSIIADGRNEILFVQSTSENALQMILKNPIDPKTFKKEWLSISSAENSSESLAITNVTVSPDGKLITITTDNQESNKIYALKVDAEKMGIKFNTLSSTVFPFYGFVKSEKNTSFKATNVQSTDKTHIELTFSHPLNARSILNPENIEIFLEGKKEKLSVEGLAMKDNKSIEITTSLQSSGDTYDLYYKNIESLYGDTISKRQSIKAKAFDKPLGNNIASLQATADLNNDGIVDFKDFTLFAAVYGKSYSDASSADLNGDTLIDFKDFTLFSSQYGEVLAPAASSGIINPTGVPHSTTHAISNLPSASPANTTPASVSASSLPSSPAPSQYVVSPTVTPSPSATGTPLPTFHYSAPTIAPNSGTGTQNPTPIPSATQNTGSIPNANPSPTPCTEDPLYCLFMS